MASLDPVCLGLIGFGTLARQVVAASYERPIKWVVLLREGSSATLPASAFVVNSVDGLVCERPELVLEVAGQQTVSEFVPQLLEAGISVVVASVGALAEERTADAIAAARKASGARLVIPSGAIGGLDYLASISKLPEAKVVYRIMKPPAAWQAELAALGFSSLAGRVVLFDGSPAEAARLYPKNTNAAFTAALAAYPANISVSVIADPALDSNIHEIEVHSSAGQALFRFTNAPSSENPKTSAVTGLSLVAAVRDYLENGRSQS